MDGEPVCQEQDREVSVQGAPARVPGVPIIGIDSDNGSDFINHHLFDDRLANRITFIRSWASHAGEGTHIAGEHPISVREVVGYHLCEARPVERDLQLAGALTAYLPGQSLVSKRNGAKVTKRCDDAGPVHQHQRLYVENAGHPDERGVRTRSPSSPVLTNLRAHRLARNPCC